MPLNAERESGRIRDPDRFDGSVLGDPLDHHALAGIEGVVDPGSFIGVVPEADQHKLAGEGTYTYLCCARVRSGRTVPKGMESLIVPAQRYAQVTVRGGTAELTKATIELARFFAQNAVAPNKKAFGLERFDEKRQSVLAPPGRYDYDVLRPLA